MKVTGIDIGASSVHLVELDGSSRKYRLTKAVSLPRPRRLADGEDGAGNDLPALIDELKSAFHEEGHTRERTLISVRGSRCILRNMNLPFRGRDELRKVLKYEAEGYIHSHSIDDVVVDAVLVQERDEGTELFMAACPKEELGDELQALHRIGVDPERADLSCCLLLEAAKSLGLFDPLSAEGVEGDEADDDSSDDLVIDFEEETTTDLLLDVGAQSVQMILVRGGELWTARVLRWGLNRLATDMAARFSVTPEEMHQALEEYFGRAAPPPPEAGEDGEEGVVVAASPVRVQEQDFVEAARSFAERIEKEITRFLSGFNLGVGLRRVLVAGGGARIPGLLGAISLAAEVPVEPLDLLGRSGVVGPDDRAPELDLAFAAALAGLGAAKPTMNFRQEEFAFRPKFDRLKLPLAISFLTLALLLLFMGIRDHRNVRRYERQIGVVDTTAKSGRVATRGKLPVYTGLLANIAHPSDAYGWIRARLRDDAQGILEALPGQPVFRRTGYIVRELRRIKKDLETKTGYFAEVKMESGLAALQAFARAVDEAAKAESIERFVIPWIHLQVGTTRKSPGYLKFIVAFRGDDYRTQNSMFRRVLEKPLGPDGPFAELELDGAEKVYTSVLNPGAEFPFKYKLNDVIPVFQPKNPD